MTGATAALLVSEKAAGVVTPATEAVTWKVPGVPLAVAVMFTRPVESVVSAPVKDADAPLAGAVKTSVALGTGLPSGIATL